MKQIRTLIVDDDPLIRDAVETMVSADPELLAVGQCADGRRAVDSIRELRPELVFLDVELPELNGFNVLAELEATETPQVVFVTGHEQYAVRAFEVSAVDYLVKPFTLARFAATLSRAKAAVSKSRAGYLTEQVEQLLHYAKGFDSSTSQASPERVVAPYTDQLLVKADGAVHFIKSSDVICIEAQGDFVKVQTTEKTQLVRETLQSLETKLDAAKFLRIHRSFLVNLDHVDRVESALYGDYSVYMDDGTKVRLSRNYRAKLKALLQREPLS